MSNYSTISQMNWQGVQSQKFKGNRSHKCVPGEQMNHRFQSSNHTINVVGRRHFDVKMTIGNQEPVKKHLRTFDRHYESNIFNFPNEKKLIKIMNKQKTQNRNEQLRNASSQFLGVHGKLGTSKIKALQRGDKKTGIYRHFYKSIQNEDFKSRSKSYGHFLFNSKDSLPSIFQ